MSSRLTFGACQISRTQTPNKRTVQGHLSRCPFFVFVGKKNLDSHAQNSAPAGADQTADDSTQMVSLYVAQKKIYPRSVQGLFAKWRWGLVFLTQIIFYGLPWLEWGQRQAVLFDLGARRFYIFGIVLYPQDFIYLTGLLVISALSLFLFTAVAGRLWCGYACPQTVYTEIFLWVEHKFEGDRSARIRLDESPFGLNKFLRKGGKHLAWIAFALWTGFTFVGYFAPIRQLGADFVAGQVGAWGVFWVLFYGLPLTVTQASCASRCANTCALTHVSRVPCLTKTP